MSTLPQKIAREKICKLEKYMCSLPQVEITLKHYFIKGLYAREMIVPKDVLMSGLEHRTKTIGIMSKGEMIVWNEDGTRPHIKAPFTHIGEPGTKRIGYAVEEVIWTTFHVTELTDLYEIEKEQFVITDEVPRMFDFATGVIRNKELQTSKEEPKCLE